MHVSLFICNSFAVELLCLYVLYEGKKTKLSIICNIAICPTDI